METRIVGEFLGSEGGASDVNTIQRQVWLIPLADETQGVQVKLCYPLTMRAIPERLRHVSCVGAIPIDITFISFAFHAPENSAIVDAGRRAAVLVWFGRNWKCGRNKVRSV